MEAKHTEGPWICDDYYNPGEPPEIRMNGIRIAHMFSPSGQSPSPAEQEANARLIVAAPALLEVCKHLEWRDRNSFYSPRCPVCYGLQKNGHQDTCELNAVLALVEQGVP